MRTSLHNPFMPMTGLSDAVAYQQLGASDGRADNTNGITSEWEEAGRDGRQVFYYNGTKYLSKKAAQNAMGAATTGPRGPSDLDGPVRPERPDPVPPPTGPRGPSDRDSPLVRPERPDPVPPPTDTTEEAQRIADMEDAYAYTQNKLDEAESAYSGLQSTYMTTMEEMGKLQTDFDSLFSDYSALGTDKSSLQGTYDDMMGQYTSLEDTLATTREQMAEKNRLYRETAASLSGLQDDFTGLQDDFTGLQGSFDNLQTDYGLTSEQLAKSLEDAAGLRQGRQDTQTLNFLQGAEADKMRRMATGTGGIGSLAPAQAQYTQAMDAMSQTGLNPTSYNMAPIDFTGGVDNNIFTPTQFSAPGADAAAGYTDIFSGPGMGLTQYGYDYGSNFNPYFDALNEQYGIPTAGVKQ